MVALPTTHRLVERRELSRADLADEPKPRWVGADDLSSRYWAGQDDVLPCRVSSVQGPAVDNIIQLLENVACGNAVAFLPAAIEKRYRRNDIVYRPVTDLPPNIIAVTWPEI